ncbi:amidohydrolase family protein [Vibrio taketomensis]|uniref:amidohydrolase family protein n=1 Tax=Vibrio taketomensis TaxID=2572923 RepID=UPI00138A250A|nr:amidohydrolase [Vibrio taketomensis]
MNLVTKTLLSSSILLALSACTSQPLNNAAIIIKHAQILPMDGKTEIIEDGTIVIQGNRIIAIGDASIIKDYSADQVIDARGKIVMPGMINGHTHIGMTAFRGLGESGVENRLKQVMFPLEKEMLDRDLIRTASRQAAMEMALAGTTTISDMYYHQDEVATAVAQVGIRGVMGETVIGFPVVDAKQPYGGLEYAEQFIQQWKGHELITPAVAPHAPYTVSAEFLVKSKQLADKYDVPLLTHLAEFRWEDAGVRKFSKQMRDDQSVVEYLASLDVLDDNLVAAHMNYLDADDMALVKQHNVGVVHCPKSNLKGANGQTPAWAMHNHGIDLGIGTDGPMSSNQNDVLTVMSYTAMNARTIHKDNSKFSPYELVELATIGGARALNMQDDIGSLEVGKKADIVIFETDSPNMQPNYDPFSTIAFSAYPQNVEYTIVNGKMIVEKGELVTVDLAEHNKEWRKVTDKVGNFAKTLK